jgi:hypothetical protein
MRGLVLAATALVGCSQVGGHDDGDRAADAAAGGDGDAAAGSNDAAAADALGSVAHPADHCADLDESGVYWVRHPDQAIALEVYCEAELGGGGWALLYNSVLDEDGGATTAFWQFDYADRMAKMGTPSPQLNYYRGDLYLAGNEYMDVITDLADTTVVAARVDTTGFDGDTMAFTGATLVAGNASVFGQQFGGGWSSHDHDADPYVDSCSVLYSSVAQHYETCWAYNLGSDADDPKLDGGVGPHVNNNNLTEMGLALQPSGGSYSRVKRIGRFTRW